MVVNLLRLALLAASPFADAKRGGHPPSPLRFAKGEGNHEGCPYVGSCPFVLRTFPPRVGETGRSWTFPP